MLRTFPGCRLIAGAYNPAKTFPDFALHRPKRLPLRGRWLFERDYRLGLTVYGKAFKRAVIDDTDIVLCSSSGFAHLVRTDAPKVVYCHNPPRWLYQQDEYLRRRFGLGRMALSLYGGRLRRDDLAGARSATCYIANSQAVAQRIRDAYDIEPVVINPPYGISPDGAERAVSGVPGEFLLLIARGRRYKHVSVAVEATQRAHRCLVVVGSGFPQMSSPYVVRVGAVDDEQLRWLYRRCEGVLAVGSEDFGLTPIEGHSFGKPALALRHGGYLETVVEGLNGSFIENLDVDVVSAALRSFDTTVFDPAAIERRARLYGPANFSARLRGLVEAVVSQAKADGSSEMGGSPRLATS